ncbi:MAG: ABC transporter ATP-binding protein [Conexivisphaerales archaeon]
MASVTLKNVTKYFGRNAVVKSVNLEVRDGEFMCILGPSGSGKTTILRMIAGLEKASSGEIYVGDELINDVPPKDRDIAMVFQNYALYPHMSVRDNISLPLRIRGKSKQFIDEKIKNVSEYLQIVNLLDKKPSQLSGGEQQRVALARAIVRDPKVFLFDEPLSNLDAKLRVTARGFLKRLQKELGTTSIYVTHDQAEAMTMADRVTVIHQGVLQQTAAPGELYSRPANVFVASFVGSPPMNLIEGTIIRKDSRAYFHEKEGRFEIPLSSSPSAEKVLLGIRPEDIQVSLTPSDGSSSAASVYVQEPLGPIQYLSLDMNGLKFLCQTSSDMKISLNQLVYFRFREDKLYFFSADSGVGLYP